ncbi:unannotated protein [freshwater metagenome]|uniref:Unannotated protein n=1 Tax=freshwater metagenome TaxID=449393 RepID=A0A6J7CTM3_9ZZZZ
MHRSDDGDLEFGKARDGVLHPSDISIERLTLLGGRSVGAANNKVAAHLLEIEAHCEVRPPGRDDEDADVIIAGHFGGSARQVLP